MPASHLYEKPQLRRILRISLFLLALVRLADIVSGLLGMLPDDVLLQELGRGEHLPAYQARMQLSATTPVASW